MMVRCEKGKSDGETGGFVPQQPRRQAKSGQRLLYRPGDVPAPACPEHAWSECVWWPGHEWCIAYRIRGRRHVVPHTGMVALHARHRRHARDRTGSVHRWAVVGLDMGVLPRGLHQRAALGVWSGRGYHGIAFDDHVRGLACQPWRSGNGATSGGRLSAWWGDLDAVRALVRMAPSTPEHAEKRSATEQVTANTHHAHSAAHVDLPADALELAACRGSSSRSRGGSSPTRHRLARRRAPFLLGSPPPPPLPP